MSVYKGFVWFNTNTIAFKKTQKNNNNYSGIKKIGHRNINTSTSL